MFRDRRDAGRQLARQLTRYANESPVVMAIPRGGVEVGYEIARALRAPLEVIVVRKLGAPGNPELGIGAIGPNDVRVLDRNSISYLGISERDLERIIAAQQTEMTRRDRLFRGDRPLPDLQNRTPILVDDGLATGVTAHAAIMALRKQQPKRIVLAVPVAARETADKLRAEVDDLVCLEIPTFFRAVGLWYDTFEQLSDDEVIGWLKRARNEYDAAASDEGARHDGETPSKR